MNPAKRIAMKPATSGPSEFRARPLTAGNDLPRTEGKPRAVTVDRSPSPAPPPPAPTSVEAAPASSLPGAEELTRAWGAGYAMAELDAGGNVAPVEDPIARRWGKPDTREGAQAYSRTGALRLERASYRYAQSVRRELDSAELRHVEQAARRTQSAIQGAEADGAGRLKGGPTGDFFATARWAHRRAEEAEILAGRWNPAMFGVPAGPEPRRCEDAQERVAAVWLALADCEALEARLRDYPVPAMAELPRARGVERRLASIQERAGRDVKFAQGVAASLADPREWRFLLTFDPSTGQANPRIVARIWADAYQLAKAHALDSADGRVWENKGDVEPDGRSAGIQGGKGWWIHAERSAREEQAEKLGKRVAALRASLAEVEALMLNPSAPPAQRREAAQHHAGLSERIAQAERELVSLRGPDIEPRLPIAGQQGGVS